MEYNTFLETVKTSLQSRLGEDFTVVTRAVPKNNGLLLEGLCIGTPSQRAVPTIYLNQYYTAYEEGMSISDILEDIINLYKVSILPPSIQPETLKSAEDVKDKIIFRLINAPANNLLLPDVPHVPLPHLELALVFYLILAEDEEGQYSALINNNQLSTWNLTAEDLLSSALINTPKLLPARIRTMREVIKEISMDNLGEDYDEEEIDCLLDQNQTISPLYVLSNPSGLHGACSICYKDILKDFASCIGKDLLILPSSIHEVLITPYCDDVSYIELSQMICKINKEEVPLEDQLSNHLYYYSQSEDRLSIAFNSSVPVGTRNP